MASCLQYQCKLTSNNRRHEQRDGIQRGVNADGNEHVHPDLPVLERVEHVLSVVFVRKRRAVLRQTVRDLNFLCWGQELRGRWVVVHAEKGNDRCSNVSTIDPTPDISCSSCTYRRQT